ncbi:hypothetical protein ACFY93_32725 [Streptomyces sp. NPDC008313]|uniref:hypothetical protein n=1 Tax=Streptomyces sp. NPDC008313 TaxID=3364826 RepID=UPI0036E280A3
MTTLRALPRPNAPAGPDSAEVLRLITEQRFPVFLTVHANGRRRYSYWQAGASQARPGGCFVALPTDECDALHAAGRIALGDPVEDRAKTTYPIRATVRSTTPLTGSPRQVPTRPVPARHALTA